MAAFNFTGAKCHNRGRERVSVLIRACFSFDASQEEDTGALLRGKMNKVMCFTD